MKFNTKRAPRALLRLPYLPILIAPFILFSPVLFTGKSLFWGTPALQFHPWRAFAWETLRAGHLPLWNPLVGMGAPLAANYQSAFFYPPGWIYFILAALGGEAAMAWGQALLVGIHLTLAGVGMAVLVRELGLGVLSQTISGLAFGLSGYLAARSHFLSINAAAAWLPWVLWGTYRLVNSRKSAGTRKNSILPPSLSLSSLSLSSLSLSSLSLSLFVSFLLLAGHAQMAWYTLLLAGMWAGFWGWRIAYSQTNPKDGGRGMLLEGIREVARAWLVLLVPVLLGVGLAAVQLIPTAELLLQSQRGGGANYDFVMTYSFWPWRFLGYLVPDLFGNPARGDYWGYANYWEDAVYVGLLPFLLALRAIFDRKKPAAQKSLVRFLLVLLVVTFVLALGQNTPVFPWLYRRVPTFNLFQAPARYTIWATFVFVLLAGYGAETWKRPIGPKARFRTIRWIVAAIAIVIAALAAGVIVPDIQPSFVRATALAGAFGIGAGVLTLFAPKPSPLSPLPSLSPLSPLPSLSPLSPLPSLSPLSISISPLSLSPPFQRKWVWAVSVFLAVDLLVAGWGLNPGIDPGFYRGDAPTASRVREMLGEGRLFLPNQDEYDLTFERYFLFDTFEGDWETLRGSLLPNLNMLDGLPSANNFDPLLPERYVRWLDAVNRADPETQAKMLDLMGVRLIERVDPANPAGVRFDPAGGLPRFRWTPCARPANNADIVWDRLVGDPDGKFPGMVNLEGGQANAEWVCGDDRQMEATAQITKVSETPNQLRVRVQSDTSGWLIIADTWYPGWRAQVDGKPARVLPADFVFRAIPTPPGTHEIVLTYQPFSFYLGAAVSTVAWIGVAFTWVRGKRDE